VFFWSYGDCPGACGHSFSGCPFWLATYKTLPFAPSTKCSSYGSRTSGFCSEPPWHLVVKEDSLIPPDR